MRLFSRRPGLEAWHVFGGYSQGWLPGAPNVVDVGSPHGALACAIARTVLSLKLVQPSGRSPWYHWVKIDDHNTGS